MAGHYFEEQIKCLIIFLDVMKLPKETIIPLLLRGDKDFCPHLSTIVDIEEYAEKLCSFAEFMIIGTPGDILGCLAYYKNVPNRFLYITHFWVNTLCQKKGYGKFLINKLIREEGYGFKEVCLEIYKIDEDAKRFYNNLSFKIKEDRGDRVLMTREIQ